MKKSIKRIVCTGLGIALLAFSGCKSSDLDPETRALKLSIGALDGNFNPFFYTAQNDGDIASMTQIAMLSTDKDGKVAYGENEPTVVLDYSQTMYDSKTGGNVTQTGSEDGRTEYEFVIKNGIKFSDGVDLTIKDVLFNLYVYLDPMYTGSATIYSTDIQGLEEYRRQSTEVSGETSTFEAQFTNAAMERIQTLVTWSQEGSGTEPDTQQAKDDLATVKSLFLKEVTSDWTTVSTSWAESYKDTHNFNAAWEAYLFNEGAVEIQTKLNDKGTVEQIKDANGKYLTTLDNWAEGAIGSDGSNGKGAQHFIDAINEATSAEEIAEYMNKNSGATEAEAKEALQRECAIDLVYNGNTDKTNIANVLTYWATATDALNNFASQERSQYYEDAKKQGNLAVPTITGITTHKVTSFKGKDLGAEHDVLKIVINGVDPKAIWNFGFGVAPMHYYSDKAHTDAANGVDKFGVEMGDFDFFQNVLSSPEKNALPVGAGAYKAACVNKDYAEAKDGGEFYSNNVVGFVRNEYFETVGSGIENAKIKRLRYSVTPDDKILEYLQTGTIDYGTPNATPTNISGAESTENLSTHTYRTGGYGYVGINPKAVPELELRQAIMKAMETSITVKNYYTSQLAEVIYRPMSMTSWAYPEGVTEWEPTAFTADDNEIIKLVKQAGYTGFDETTKTGKWKKDGKELKLTFTIAGETKNHPAWDMFTKAADRLNNIGFNVTVTTDIQALKKLASGNLQVWAAAWSSGIDPDMYQTYHKDSKASSVINWNYPGILNDTQGIYTREYIIVQDLSDLIEKGRSMLDEPSRTAVYKDCLDKIMELAVELPTYQRNDLCVWNDKVIDSNSLFLDKTRNHNIGPISKIWEIDYVK